MAGEKMLPPLVLELRAKASELIAEVRTAASETEKAAATSKRAAGEIEGAAARTGAATEEAAGRSSAGWQKFMGVSKAAAIGVVGAGAVVGVESIKMASEFQSSMTLLQTAGGESAANMKTVSDGVLSIARATGVSTEQLSEGMYTVEKAGMRGAAGLKVLKAAAEGAKAENVDLSVATNALTSVMMSYHKGADQAVSVQNMLVAGSGMAKTSMQEYASSLSTVIPIASAAGVGFDQVAGAVATLTQHGTSAQEATQELANTIRNLQAPNAVAQKAMQQLGLSVNDVSKGLSDPKVGLQGTIEKITGAIREHMGPAGTVVVDAFNKSASATKDLQTMIDKMPPSLAQLSKGLLDGTTTVGDYTKAYKGFGGQAGAMGGQFLSLYKNANGFNQLLKSGTTDQQTAAAALKNMMGGATGLNTALMLSGESGKYFSKATEEVAKAGKKAGDNISTWGKTQKTFSVQMSRLKEDVQTAAISIGAKLLPPVQAFVGFLANHPAVLITFAALIGTTLVAAATLWTVNAIRMSATTDGAFLNMIGKAAVWVASTAASVAESIALWAMYALEGIGSAVASAATGFASMIASAASWAATTAVSVGQTVALWAMYAAQGIGRAVAAAATGFASMIASGARWAAQQAVQLAKGVAGFVAWAAEHAIMAGAFIAENVAMAASATAAFIAENAATLGIVAAIGLIVGAVVWLATHWHQAWDAIKTAAVWVYDHAIKPVGDAIVNDVIHPIVGAVQWYLGIWTAVWHGVEKAASWAYNNVIKPVAGWIMDNAIHPIGSAISWLGGVWSSIWDGIKSAVDAVWRFLKPIFDAIGGAIKTIVGGIGKVGSFIGGGISKIGSLLGFANGGVIPGAPGAPRLIVAHGGEVVLSRDMLAGKQQAPPELLNGAVDAHPYKAASPTQRALTSSTAAPAAAGPSSTGGAPTVVVNVSSPANPAQIAAEVGWTLRKTA